MTVTTITLLSINENEPAALGEYFRIVGPVLERAGGKIVKRFRMIEMVAGKRPALTAVIVEYPDRAAVDLVLKSHKYQSASTARNSAFLRFSVSIGLGDEQPIATAEQMV